MVRSVGRQGFTMTTPHVDLAKTRRKTPTGMLTGPRNTWNNGMHTERRQRFDKWQIKRRRRVIPDVMPINHADT
ncbi:MAG: hypothetical protein AAF420_10730 [Pseudomonadota bacterium]